MTRDNKVAPQSMTAREAALAHPDCQRQLRDMVLAAVPGHIEAEPENSQAYADGFNDAIDCTLPRIKALFDKEPTND